MIGLQKLVMPLGFVLATGLAAIPAIAGDKAYTLNGSDLVPMPGAAVSRDRGTMIIHGWTGAETSSL